MGINLCHILHIQCCIDCEHNSREHNTALEFRPFDLEVGARLEQRVILVQRIVQYAIAATAAGLDVRQKNMQGLSFHTWMGCLGLSQEAASWQEADVHAANYEEQL